MEVANSGLWTAKVDGLATGILGWARRWFSGGLARVRRERSMELIETLSLGGRRQLMLVTCEGRRLLVGVGSDGVHAMMEMREQAAIEEGKRPAGWAERSPEDPIWN